jgi:hypothetical protein
MDFDPRDFDDSRDRNEDLRERDEEWREPGHGRDLGDGRDRNDDAGPHIGRGPSSHEKSEYDPRNRDDERWPDRERGHDPREVFTRNLDLPRGLEREIVRDRDREYTLRASESRTLATVGVFRVVSSRDLRDHHDRPVDPRSGDLRHLREQGLIETVRVPGYREHAVALTKDGRSLLEHHRDRDREHPQTFYAGVRRDRELEHDVQVYRAYEREAEALLERGVSIGSSSTMSSSASTRRGCTHAIATVTTTTATPIAPPRKSVSGRSSTTYFDDEVHFPDVRIEYQEPDGRWDHRDVEVTTEHYRSAHGASVARSGFSCYRGSSLRIGGHGGGRGGGGRNGGLAEEFWR